VSLYSNSKNASRPNEMTPNKGWNTEPSVGTAEGGVAQRENGGQDTWDFGERVEKKACGNKIRTEWP